MSKLDKSNNNKYYFSIIDDNQPCSNLIYFAI